MALDMDETIITSASFQINKLKPCPNQGNGFAF
jgi:hypothetical protein